MRRSNRLPVRQRLTSFGRTLMTFAAASLPLAGCAHTSDGSTLAAFEANLAGHASATEALQRWCDARAIAPGATIRVRFVRGADAAAPADMRSVLDAGPDEPIGYRHVQLMCGDTVLSDAHNWFVPARLTPEMNRELAETEVPFGRIAASLQFTREPLSAARQGDPTCPAGVISTHRARLMLPDGRPLAYVQECYSAANIG
ncbi:MAG: chorismate--pyruvate lyase family protein [Novosphingobium sp.]